MIGDFHAVLNFNGLFHNRLRSSWCLQVRPGYVLTFFGFLRSEMTLYYWMMVERYPNLKEEVGGTFPGYEISSFLHEKTCQVVNYLLMCFGARPSAFCL